MHVNQFIEILMQGSNVYKVSLIKLVLCATEDKDAQTLKIYIWCAVLVTAQILNGKLCITLETFYEMV